MPSTKYNEWNRKQIEAYHSTRRYLYTLFGGAKGGGKSVGGARIHQCDISNYRDGIFIVMRKNYTVLRNTTVRTFEKFFDPALIKAKVNNKWHCINNNQIWFWAADQTRDPNYERTRGLEATSIMFDEASEGSQDLYELLPSLLRQPAISLDTREPWTGNIYMTSNPVPGTNYLKRNFIDPRTRVNDGRHNFIQSLPDHNPLLPEGYIDKAFGTMNSALKAMLRYGRWDVEESEFMIVPTTDLLEIAWQDIIPGRLVAAGIDIGLGRPDQTCVYVADEAGHIYELERFGEYDTTVQYTRLAPIVAQIKANDGEVWIDAASVGKGVADQLIKRFGDITVKPVTFGESPQPEEATTTAMPYENRRAQMYFWAREDVMASAAVSRAGMRPSITWQYSEHLEEELQNTFFLPVDGKLRIEPKDSIKERIGRSPDDADAFVLCNAARRAYKTRPVHIAPRNRERKQRRSSILTGY